MKRCVYTIPMMSLLTMGCDDTASLEEYLAVSLQETIATVESVCENGGCDGPPNLALTLSLDADSALPENDEIEFLQYRVDYTIPGETLPYFAAPVEAVVQNNSDTALILRIAGSRQRQSLSHVEGDTAIGTARLTLAGYDEKDHRVDYDFGFNIQFGDFVTWTTDEPGGTQ